MTTGAGIAGRAEIVVRAEAAEVQLRKLRAVGIPLKHHHLRPVVPDRGGQYDVLIDPDIALRLCTARDREAMFAEAAVFAAVSVGKIDRTLVVEGLMDGESAWIGVVTAKIAARRRLEGQRHRRA